ncbi:MAG: glycosyltransferase [Muribaculaceae bacterium]|nr:glycosyltransferase [Muribaculaceae bacterium]
MDTEKSIIVISGINLRSGGPLTIIRDCLEYLSFSDIAKEYRIIALVHKKDLFNFQNIEYIEFPDSASSWLKRIYYEYFYFKTLSKKLKPYLWLSLHDITPRVESTIQAVYMHNPSIVNKIKITDWKFDKAYIAFSLFYKILYKINIHNNNFCIVQQNWFKEICSKLLNVPTEKFIVARPNRISNKKRNKQISKNKCQSFFFPSFPRPFKNFETLCEAARIIEDQGISNIKIVITLNGSENSYSKWIYEKFKRVKSIEFKGILNKSEMSIEYENTDCLIFPSRLETWGLPISEFIPFNKPIIVADEPYAHETAEGADRVAYFKTNDAKSLAKLIIETTNGNFSSFKHEPKIKTELSFASNYKDLFNILLNKEENGCK